MCRRCARSMGRPQDPQAKVRTPGTGRVLLTSPVGWFTRKSLPWLWRGRVLCYGLQIIASALPGQGESSQCLMCKIFSSLDLAWASSQILSYLAISS